MGMIVVMIVVMIMVMIMVMMMVVVVVLLQVQEEDNETCLLIQKRIHMVMVGMTWTDDTWQ